jgi:uncharacterized damage-inducible protein DinB
MHSTRWALSCLLVSQTAAAQTTAYPTMLADWQRDKGNVLAYVAAMPDSAMTFRPTPGVRTFAEQIEHIVISNVEIAAIALLGEAKPPVLGDKAKFLHDKAALQAYAAAAYDYVLTAMQRATPEQWQRRVPMYGQPPELPARWLDLAHEHSAWTLGQVVPYLRLNGVTPPTYSIPF